MARRLTVVSSATLSLAAHAIALLIVAIALASKPSTAPDGAPAPYTRLTYTASGAGPGSRDTGGKETPARVRRAESVAPDLRQPSQPIAVSQPAVLAGLQDAIGVVTELRQVEFSGAIGPGGRGHKGGTGEGGEGGPGNRAGPGGDGDGLEPGNGVSWPRLVREVKPNYTPEAVRARREGKVELEIVVLPDGTVGRVRIVRSLDSVFGLDQAAIDAVRRWRFEPGRQLGKAVSVRVGVELSFILR